MRPSPLAAVIVAALLVACSPAPSTVPATPTPAALATSSPSAGPTPVPSPTYPPDGSTTVVRLGGGYDPADTTPAAPAFRTGEPAAMSLSGCGLHAACGGASGFYMPAMSASDGTHFALADGYDNRVLLWNTVPDAARPADLVLGQPGFDTSTPGTGLAGMHKPYGVAFANGALIVSDSYNSRLLVWRHWPTRSGQPADYAIRFPVPDPPEPGFTPLMQLPYGIWTDGTRLVVVDRSGPILIWKRLPTSARRPDIILNGDGSLGTPRSVASDGRHLVVGTHDSSLWWDTFPTRSGQRPDFVGDTQLSPRPSGAPPSAPMAATFLPDGGLAGIVANQLLIWRAYPTGPSRIADLAVGDATAQMRPFAFQADGSLSGSIALIGGRLFIVEGINLVAVYDRLPTAEEQLPDWYLGGATHPNDDPRLDAGHLFGPWPVSDGTSLWAVDGFSGAMAVWSRIPDTDGASPDWLYRFADGPGVKSVALGAHTLVVVSSSRLRVWDELPRDGELPSRVLEGRVGTVVLQVDQGGSAAKAAAIGPEGFWLSTPESNRVYLWKGGVPADGVAPDLALDLPGVTAISTDGTHVVFTSGDDPVAEGDPFIRAWRVDELLSSGGKAPPMLAFGAQPERADGRHGLRGQAWQAILVGKGLAVAAFLAEEVCIWSDLEQMKPTTLPSAILGARSDGSVERTLLHPVRLAWDGRYLWVGEFKFGDRLLRFDPAGG